MINEWTWEKEDHMLVMQITEFGFFYLKPNMAIRWNEASFISIYLLVLFVIVVVGVVWLVVYLYNVWLYATSKNVLNSVLF